MSEETTDAPASRRSFLTWLTRGFLSLWAVGSAWVVGAFVRAPHSKGATERVIKVGLVDDLAVGQAVLVQHGKLPIWVIRTAEDQWVGLSGVCTHLHCVLTWDGEQQILGCPCHEGSFDLNGNVRSGPPPRALSRHNVETQLGQVYVDTTPKTHA